MANEESIPPKEGGLDPPKEGKTPPESDDRSKLSYCGVTIGEVTLSRTLIELKALARKVFVQVSGTKAQLVARIINQILQCNNRAETETAPPPKPKPETSRTKCASFTSTNKKCSRFAEKDGIYCSGHKYNPHTEKVNCAAKGCTDTAEPGYKHCSKHNPSKKIPCKGYTKQGHPCANKAQAGKAFCARHDPDTGGNPNTDKAGTQGGSSSYGGSSYGGSSWYDQFWDQFSRRQKAPPPPPPVYANPSYTSSGAFIYFGLSATTATYAEVKKCYRKLALIHHPDKGGKKEDFAALQNHYDALKRYYGEN